MTGSLADVPLGADVRLGAPLEDLAPRRRLAELGLRAGATVRVVARTSGGGRVVAVGLDRIALDRATAALVPAEPVVAP